MSCPEGSLLSSELVKSQEADVVTVSSRAAEPEEGDVSVDYKPQKNWKKSLTNFFRQIPRSTKSNDGDQMSGSTQDISRGKEISPEQKWQSLGKMFRKQSLVDSYRRSQEYRSQYGESSNQNKRTGIKKMLTNYFQKSSPALSKKTVTKPEDNLDL